MSDFAKEITPGGTGWFNLLTLMQANGFTGGARLSFLTLEEENGNSTRFKLGHSSATVAPVSATDGKSLTSKSEIVYEVDAPLCWIYFAANTPINISAQSPLDF